MREQLPTLSVEWQRKVIAGFRGCYQVQMSDEELQEFMVESAGKITDESILEHAGPGHIRLSYEGGDTYAQTFFHADWDEEHGVPIEWDIDDIM